MPEVNWAWGLNTYKAGRVVTTGPLKGADKLEGKWNQQKAEWQRTSILSWHSRWFLWETLARSPNLNTIQLLESSTCQNYCESILINNTNNCKKHTHAWTRGTWQKEIKNHSVGTIVKIKSILESRERISTRKEIEIKNTRDVSNWSNLKGTIK